ncbi:MAG: ribonuclease R [Stomatobaculum sp.]|nr:ribonuclease R [Stomatobaculum sp.]
MTSEEMKNRKEVILHLMSDPMYRPMRLREIAIFLNVPKSKRKDLEDVLNALVAEGKIRVSGRGKYGKEKKHEFAGLFMGNEKGFGFVRPENSDTDIFIGKDCLHGALDGDMVQVTVDPGQSGRRAEGRVTRILKRANTRIVGYFRQDRKGGIVHPDNRRISADIQVPPGKTLGASTGHKVVVRITRFQEHREELLQGEVTEDLGHVNTPGTDILSIVRAFDLPADFSGEVLKEAEEAALETPDKVMKSPEAAAERKDLRGLKVITIDGEDAKDLDDAVSLRTLENGNRELGVHIADVSSYVKENSLLDREALRRGTSVYLADRVIPMLPRVLSNGICSLNEGEDRLTLSCIMEIDTSGSVVRHEICGSVIRSSHRMTYTEVQKIIETAPMQSLPEELQRQYADVIPMILEMDLLAKKLREKRRERGGIDFDFPETKVLLDENGRTVGIRPYERNDATRLIEDFMIAANETVAQEYCWAELPFLYRIHDKPDPEKMNQLSVFVNNFGYIIRGRNGEIHPKEIQKLLEKAEGTEEERLISRITLRSLKRACYSTDCSGHFGLASRYYTHFTSPIRRYPDLMIHRIIRQNLRGELDENRIRRYDDLLPEVAKETSALERRADEAERESVRFKICEYMEEHIGEIHEGVVSGVTRFGLFVTLKNTVEGMIRVQDLPPDYYDLFSGSYELVGELTGRRYRLGDRLNIKVSAADKLARTVNFIPAGEAFRSVGERQEQDAEGERETDREQ